MLRFQAEVVAGGKKVEMTTKPGEGRRVRTSRWGRGIGTTMAANVTHASTTGPGVPRIMVTALGRRRRSSPPGSSGLSPIVSAEPHCMRIPAVACSRLGTARCEVDFGTNLSGWLRMRLPTLTAGQLA